MQLYRQAGAERRRYQAAPAKGVPTTRQCPDFLPGPHRLYLRMVYLLGRNDGATTRPVLCCRAALLLLFLADAASPSAGRSATWSWKEDLSLAPTANPNIDRALISDVLLAAGGHGWQPKEDPAAVDSTTLGLVGMYHFDAAPADKGTEPDLSSRNLTIDVVGPLVSQVAGKFDKALSFPGSTKPGNLAQIPADAWMAVQPQLGCAVSTWINVPSGGSAAGGYIYERVYDGFELQFDGRLNQTHCTVRDAAGKIYTPTSYQYKQSDFGTWVHHVCTYDNTVGNTTMYVGGVAVGSIDSRTIATTGLNHGDHQMFGFGARPTNAGEGHGFVGAIDEVAIFDRALTAAEAAKLAARTEALTPFPGNSFVSTLIHTDATAVLEYWDLTLKYTTTPVLPVLPGVAVAAMAGGEPLLVEISTNRGKSWCAVKNGGSLGLDSEECHVPAKHFMCVVFPLPAARSTCLPSAAAAALPLLLLYFGAWAVSSPCCAPVQVSCQLPEICHSDGYLLRLHAHTAHPQL